MYTLYSPFLMIMPKSWTNQENQDVNIGKILSNYKFYLDFTTFPTDVLHSWSPVRDPTLPPQSAPLSSMSIVQDLAVLQSGGQVFSGMSVDFCCVLPSHSDLGFCIIKTNTAGVPCAISGSPRCYRVLFLVMGTFIIL